MTCPKCQLSNATCICSQLKQVAIEPQILIIRHYKESFRKSNSARILELTTNNVSIIEYGRKDQQELPFINLEGSVVLFPTENEAKKNNYTSNVTPQRIIVLDGSWKQARRMYRRLTFLKELPHLDIQLAVPPLPRIRKPNFINGMSTMEACIQGISLFEDIKTIEALKLNYCIWLNQVRLNTGIRQQINPGESFKQARIKQDIIDGKPLPP
jgi:DTW domain-containing protein